MADSPVVAYQIKQSNGAVQADRQELRLRPLRLAIPKTSGMTTPILAALKVLMANGTYTAILTKWGIQSGRDHHAEDQRRDELRAGAGVLERGHQRTGAARGDQGRPVRRPGRWIAGAVVLVIAAR
jgi:hypothetical protein